MLKATIIINENKKLLKAITFYLKLNSNYLKSQSMVITGSVNNSEYKIILGEKRLEEIDKNTLAASITLPKEIDITHEKLSDFLNPIISEKEMKEQIESHIKSFISS